MKVYGITGGIGAGKSAVTSVLRMLGHPVVDLDQVSRDLVVPGSLGIAKIGDAFGAAYLNPDGTLNRKMLADLVFNDKTELAKLDALMGPLLWAEVERRRREAKGALLFVDGALIIEKGMHEKFDGTILVTAPFAVRVRRAMARDDATPEQIKARVESQMPDADKRRIADFVVDNSGTLHELRTRTLALLEMLEK